MGEVGATFKMDIMRDNAQESVLLLFYFFILAGWEEGAGEKGLGVKGYQTIRGEKGSKQINLTSVEINT